MFDFVEPNVWSAVPQCRLVELPCHASTHRLYGVRLNGSSLQKARDTQAVLYADSALYVVGSRAAGYVIGQNVSIPCTTVVTSPSLVATYTGGHTRKQAIVRELRLEGLHVLVLGTEIDRRSYIVVVKGPGRKRGDAQGLGKETL